MKSCWLFLGQALLLHVALATTFNVQVTSTCTNYTGVTCTTWSQTGTIIEETAACFPGNTQVLTQSGPKAMSQLKLRDRILGYNRTTGKDEYTSVEAWLHRSVNQSTKYLILQTSDLAFTVSDMHNVADGREYGFAAAKDMLGRQLMSNLANQTVQRISEVVELGVYAPLTILSNFYVEAGKGRVLVHCYAHINYPQYYEPYFTPIVRIYEHFLPSSEDAEGIHPVGQFFSSVRSFLWSKGQL